MNKPGIDQEAIGQAEAEGTSDSYRYPAPRTEEQLRDGFPDLGTLTKINM
ncbi:hypothetical protein ACE3MS_28800 [Paenibacillus dendritiformis]